jgi:hypothetical protein
MAYWNKNKTTITIGVGLLIVTLAILLVKMIIPHKRKKDVEKTRKKELERNIIRKRLLKELEPTFRKYEYTNEEIEHILEQKIDEELKNVGKISLKGYKEYVKTTPPISDHWANKLKNAVGGKCEYHCQKDYNLTPHHIVARNEGGKHSLNNVVVLCPDHHALAEGGSISKNLLREVIRRPNRFNANKNLPSIWPWGW